MQHKKTNLLLITLVLFFTASCLAAEQPSWAAAWWNRLKTRVMNNVAYYTPSFVSRFVNRWKPDPSSAQALHAQHEQAEALAPQQQYPEPFTPEYTPALKANVKKELFQNIKNLKEYKKDTANFVAELAITQRLLGTLVRIQETERLREIAEKVLSEVNAHIETPTEKKRKHLIFRIQVAQELP